MIVLFTQIKKILQKLFPPKNDGWFANGYTRISPEEYAKSVARIKNFGTEFHSDELGADGWYVDIFPQGIVFFQSRRTKYFYKRG